MVKTCEVVEDGVVCGKPRVGGGLCRKHYMRKQRTGSVELRPKPDQICSADGCDEKVGGAQWCGTHRMAEWRAANPERSRENQNNWQRANVEKCRDYQAKYRGPPSLIYGDDERRFWSYVTLGPSPEAHTLAAIRGIPGSCQLWLGTVKPDKRGRIWVGGVEWIVHRYSYELHGGVLDPELEIDHLCQRPLCVRFDHLEQVTHQENHQRYHSSLARRKE